MNCLTKLGLNLLQKTKLDYFTIRALNNKICNPLLLKYCWQVRDYHSFYGQYKEWEERLKKNGITFKDKRILDFGAGGSIGLGYFFLKADFEFWLAVDLYNNLKTDKKLIKKETVLLEEIFKNYNKNIFNDARIEKDNIIFSDKLDFRQLEITDSPEEPIGKFDIIISSAVLEHIPDRLTERIMADLSNYLKTGGLMIHEIDLRDHVNVANPFNFYKYSRERWDKLAGDTIFYNNRLRLVDYLKIFNKLNFKTKFIEAQTESLPARIKIDNFFNKYKKEELEATRVFIILEKL